MAENILDHKLDLILAQMRVVIMEVSHIKAIVETIRSNQTYSGIGTLEERDPPASQAGAGQ